MTDAHMEFVDLVSVETEHGHVVAIAPPWSHLKRGQGVGIETDVRNIRTDGTVTDSMTVPAGGEAETFIRTLCGEEPRRIMEIVSRESVDWGDEDE